MEWGGGIPMITAIEEDSWVADCRPWLRLFMQLWVHLKQRSELQAEVLSVAAHHPPLGG